MRGMDPSLDFFPTIIVAISGSVFGSYCSCLAIQQNSWVWLARVICGMSARKRIIRCMRMDNISIASSLDTFHLLAAFIN